MKGIVCQSCGFIAINDKQPEKCPVCTNVEFTLDENAIHQPGDETNFSEPEKKHIPALVVVEECGLIDRCKDVHA